MKYSVRLSTKAYRQLCKLDKPVRTRIEDYLFARIHGVEDPRYLGKSLTDDRHWSYRVGDYRILAIIEDDVRIVWVERVGHRSDVYRC